MPDDLDIARCLSSITQVSRALAADLDSLSPDEWDGPTNCPPWRVRELAAHIVVSGEGFAASVRQGLAGSVDPPGDQEERLRRHAALESSDPATVARALRTVTADFVGIYDGLDQRDLGALCYHRRGNQPVRWYAAHRLAEVAFHYWDVDFSLGREPELDQHVAQLLLPTLLQSNAPRTYAAGLTPQRGSGERFLLAVKDDPGASWVITIDPEQLLAERGSGPADLSISGSAADLALLAYGRLDLKALAQSGALRLDGDLAMADRFPLIFPRP